MALPLIADERAYRSMLKVGTVIHWTARVIVTLLVIASLLAWTLGYSDWTSTVIWIIEFAAVEASAKFGRAHFEHARFVVVTSGKPYNPVAAKDPRFRNYCAVSTLALLIPVIVWVWRVTLEM